MDYGDIDFDPDSDFDPDCGRLSSSMRVGVGVGVVMPVLPCLDTYETMHDICSILGTDQICFTLPFDVIGVSNRIAAGVWIHSQDL